MCCVRLAYVFMRVSVYLWNWPERYIYIYGVLTAFLAGESPGIRSYLEYIHRSGQPSILQMGESLFKRPQTGSVSCLSRALAAALVAISNALVLRQPSNYCEGRQKARGATECRRLSG